MNISANIGKLYAYSFLKMTLFPMAIITLFWKDRVGLTLTQILLIQSILSFVTVLCEYPAGYLSDRWGYRSALSIASLFGLAGWSLYTVAHHFSDVLLAEILLGVSLSFISGSDSALLYETLKTRSQETCYARYEGRMNGFGQLGEAAGALFAGTLYAAAPLLPFFLQVGVWVMALLVARTLAEPQRSISPSKGHLTQALAIARQTVLQNRHLRYTMLLNSVLGIASFYPVWLIQPYMKDAGVPVALFGPIWTGANLTVAFFSLASHRLHYRLGDRTMAYLFLCLVLIGYLGLGVCGATGGFLFYYLLTTLRGMRGPMMLNHIQKQTPSAHRAGILSLQTLCFRLLFACTGPLVGMLSDRVGVRYAFGLLLVPFLIVLPPLVRLFVRHASPRPQAG